ncbi:TrmH family RNA methyltransferase [Corynebacterium auris]|uniref:TrmH family RNA methyltransferase n=1 Tax=Corynebacterium auris TaxID=44750 RepID=UPI0025B50E42|nr:RNA methyltransferase [Corynebacterium auris]WJY67578.1 Putative TrmH family tRNA/rRNA methyltransferase [Corynebacterium auris]
MTRRTTITDPADPRLDDIRDLKHSDTKKDLVFAEGPLVCGRLVESRFPVRSVIGFGGRLDSFLADFGAQLPPGVPVYEVTRELLGSVAGYDMHRGLLAVGERPAPLSVAEVIEGARTVVVLEGVGDHENIGSIFRNAAGMGVDGVLFGAATADPLYRRSVRVSMGHALRTPFAHLDGTSTTWQRSLEQLRDEGWWLVSLTPADGAVHIKDALAGRENDKVALLVGAEGPGLTEHAMRATDVRAKIPMAEGTDSLNVATSAAVAFYERARQAGA